MSLIKKNLISKGINSGKKATLEIQFSKVLGNNQLLVKKLTFQQI